MELHLASGAAFAVAECAGNISGSGVAGNGGNGWFGSVAGSAAGSAAGSVGGFAFGDNGFGGITPGDNGFGAIIPGGNGIGVGTKS